MLSSGSGIIKKTIGFGFDNFEKWGGVDWRKELKKGDSIDVVYELDANEWNGNKELQLRIVDLKKS